jgi:hypothetical protein
MTRIKKRRKICFVLLYALNKQHAILKQVDAIVVLNSEEEFQFAISFVVKFTQHLKTFSKKIRLFDQLLKLM